MSKLLKIILLLQLFGWITATALELQSQPIVMVIALIIIIFVWLAIWKGTVFIVKNPESISKNKKANLIRWIISFPYSVFAVQIGVMAVYLLRFLFFDRSSVIVSWYENLGAWAGRVMILLALIIAFPFLYLLGKAFKFKNPIHYAIIFILLFAILMLIIGPMLQSNS
jgi:hypothetical protein